MLADRIGLDEVRARGDRSIHATGTVHGRRVEVDIEADPKGSELLRSERWAGARRPRPRDLWRTELTVGCANPRGLAGTISSAVDVEDPAWDPRNFEPSHCRVVAAEPDSLAAAVLTESVRKHLSSIHVDVAIGVEPDAVRLRDERSMNSGAGFVAGSVVHHHQGSPPPWPDRAVIGPPWWIGVLCEIADAVDAPDAADRERDR